MPYVHRPHVRLQKLPFVMKGSLHLPKDFCKGKQAVKCLQSGEVHGATLLHNVVVRVNTIQSNRRGVKSLQ